ncbi:hypothetical protein M430DRAFT_53590 [Amorphotheca resinae ATCC 22711]|uniref:Prefoldin subunit 6 n=1 Tax=Amorphotheca resinae ATCC 22711 TaxID=857342 RepID=A0A2T3ARQ0_AMORE|nr:hypothetical protein M430DRAFT_53590 [Amorphotheca resinae ATCC 22711]PSS09030.1 hypothetical protein M430DRAFT_53590 [Amorphotheca resinae ATCC 22711]
MAELQQRLQALSEEYQKAEQELQQHIQSRQRLEAQLQENKQVKKEFSGLDDDANIYKLVGPVLLKQDRKESMLAVDGRLEFIDKEIKRFEKQIKEAQEKSDKLKMEIIQVQSQAQPEQGAQA